MGSGKDFEDALMDSLEEWVGDSGVPMLRKQQMSFRRGSVQLSQEVDIMVDSPNAEYYIGIEAKSRNASSTPGIYFSQINPQQFHDQVKYAEQSGRDVFVAVELRERENDPAYIVPLALFTLKDERDATKVSWEEIEYFGVKIGEDQEYNIERAAIEAVLDVDRRLRADPDVFDTDLETLREDGWITINDGERTG